MAGAERLKYGTLSARGNSLPLARVLPLRKRSKCVCEVHSATTGRFQVCAFCSFGLHRPRLTATSRAGNSDQPLAGPSSQSLRTPGAGMALPSEQTSALLMLLRECCFNSTLLCRGQGSNGLADTREVHLGKDDRTYQARLYLVTLGLQPVWLYRLSSPCPPTWFPNSLHC